MSTTVEAEPKAAKGVPSGPNTIGHRNGDGGDTAMDEDEDVVGEDVEIVIPNVPPDVLAVIDSQARSRRISRAEYVKLLMIREREAMGNVTRDDLRRVANMLRDVDEPESTPEVTE